MSNHHIMQNDAVLMTLPHQQWDASIAADQNAIEALEQGKVLFLSKLAFPLTADEITLLNPALISPKRKNISFQPQSKQLSTVVNAAQRQPIQQLLMRHHQACCQLIATVLPKYQQALHTPTNSLRLHLISDWKASTSWRKDDSRLHIDAFPSRPNRGERILRIFTNINPEGKERTWRIGEPFLQLAQRFLPRLNPYSPLNSWLQHRMGITKTRRSHYDHLMLQMHDLMKANQEYQQYSPQIEINFPSGSSWICFSDQTPHAAMKGQFMLEQTFLLPITKMNSPHTAPLKILEKLLNKPLI